MKTKEKYKLSDLINLDDTRCKFFDVAKISWTTPSMVRHNYKFYTTRKNLELAELYIEFIRLNNYVGNIKGLDKEAVEAFQRDLTGGAFHSMCCLITEKYGNDDGRLDDLYDCVIDPDNENKFMVPLIPADSFRWIRSY
jgi:hypothetical protein